VSSSRWPSTPPGRSRRCRCTPSRGRGGTSTGSAGCCRRARRPARSSPARWPGVSVWRPPSPPAARWSGSRFRCPARGTDCCVEPHCGRCSPAGCCSVRWPGSSRRCAGGSSPVVRRWPGSSAATPPRSPRPRSGRVHWSRWRRTSRTPWWHRCSGTPSEDFPLLRPIGSRTPRTRAGATAPRGGSTPARSRPARTTCSTSCRHGRPPRCSCSPGRRRGDASDRLPSRARGAAHPVTQRRLADGGPRTRPRPCGWASAAAT